MPSNNTSKDDALNGILPIQPEKPIAPPPKKFKAWHRPRKQYVRKFQWLAEIQRLIEIVHFPEDAKVFRYLSLPGNDLLDVRCVRNVCEVNGLSLKYVGLNSVTAGSPDEIELNLAANDVKSLSGIHLQSVILIEKFEAIGEPKSLAYEHVYRAAPYHCINVDLCNYVAAKPQTKRTPTYIDAIAELIRVQTKLALHGWLLFLTTRVGPDSINARNLSALIDAIQINTVHNESFREGIQAMIQTHGEELNQRLRAVGRLTAAQFKDIFCIGFGKWLLSFLQSAQPRMEFIKLPSYYYSVVPGQPDMVSLAYRCHPKVSPPTDQFKLVRDPAPHPQLSESAMAMTFLKATRAMSNVDELLAKDQALMNSMIDETEALLRGANYPVDDQQNGYRIWLQKGAPHG